MTPQGIVHWNYPTHVIFGAGAIAKLPKSCRNLGMTRPLLVTDQGLRDSDILRRTLSLLEAEGVAVGLFTDVKGNPSSANVMAGLAAYREGGHDGVIAFGGGSGLDAAKTIAFMVPQTRPLWDFEDGKPYWREAVTEGLPPVIAIPTTAGTGSEVGRAAVITHEAEHRKVIIFHPRFLPELVIADPELTYGLPPALTAATGMDALVHAFEAFCAPGYHPMADGIALEAMRLVHGYLARAVKQGDDAEARANMLAAAAMGATAFQKGLGGVHALAHTIGALYDTQHGLTNAILLPYVMDANREAIAPAMDRLARVLGLAGPGFDGVKAWVLALRREIGIPETLAAIGVDAERADEVGERAVRDPSAGGNPIPHDAQTYADIFRRAVTGDGVNG